MPAWLRWVLGLSIFALVAGVPLAYFRAEYAYAKRLREVTAGKFYRCGQLNADGLLEAIRLKGIRTVVNLQHENPDPMLDATLFRKGHRKLESQICEEEGVKYLLITFDPFPREPAPGWRPPVIDKFLAIMDDPSNYPVLIHCKAGLHRTGELTAIYRMEYEGWSKAAATRELKANGFGDYACTTADDMVYNLVAKYKTGERRPTTAAADRGASP